MSWLRASSARPASFDSSTAMVNASARFLEGRGFTLLGSPFVSLLRPMVLAANHLPEPARQFLYALGSGREREHKQAIARTTADSLDALVVRAYRSSRPSRFPVAFVGSASGPVVHLAAALRGPFIPQTLLLPYARRGHPDDPIAEIDGCQDIAATLCSLNPTLSLHQMIDPNNDWLTLKWFAYFRVKHLAVTGELERFLTSRLATSPAIVVCACSYQWPQTVIGERHYFQVGGAGGLDPSEYANGSERVAAVLRRHGLERPHWEVPRPDVVAAEAEWGYEAELTSSVLEVAERVGARVLRLTYRHPDGLSALVADLYRRWYRTLGVEPHHLFVESFVLVDPYRVLRARAVPFWMAFNGEDGRDALERYLESRRPFEEISLALVANGVRAAGLVSLDEWRTLLHRATRTGRFAGLDEQRYPADLSVFARFGDILDAQARDPIPDPLPVAFFEEFCSQAAQRYDVGFEVLRDA